MRERKGICSGKHQPCVEPALGLSDCQRIRGFRWVCVPSAVADTKGVYNNRLILPEPLRIASLIWILRIGRRLGHTDPIVQTIDHIGD